MSSQLLPSTSTTRYSWFFWLIAIYTMLHMVLFIIFFFDFITHPLAPEYQYQSVGLRLFMGIVIVPLALIVSVLVLRRTPGNITGLCLLLWLTTIMGDTMRPDSPLIIYNGLNVGWSGLWLLGLFFPNGRSAFPHAERWIQGLVVWLITGLLLFNFVTPALAGSTTPGLPLSFSAANPVFIPALAPLMPIFEVGFLNVPLVAISLLVLPSLFVRYRRGDSRTRLQIRWLAWVLGVIIISAVALRLFGLTAIGSDGRQYGQVGYVMVIVWGVLATLGPYLAVGIAILRYRLYDIDIIIRKTLQYSLVTAVLGLTYFGCVVLLQWLFTAVSGQRSAVAIVLSTLLIAALFNPLRRRIQNFIDRRFFRKKYDAAQVLAQFAQTARDETNMEVLQAELLRVVQETMQPNQVSIWLKG